MLETILERVNALTTNLETLRGEVDTLRGEVREFRDEQNTKLDALRKEFLVSQHKIERQIMVLNDQFLKIRTDQTLIEDRLDQVESKAS